MTADLSSVGRPGNIIFNCCTTPALVERGVSAADIIDHNHMTYDQEITAGFQSDQTKKQNTQTAYPEAEYKKQPKRYKGTFSRIKHPQSSISRSQDAMTSLSVFAESRSFAISSSLRAKGISLSMPSFPTMTGMERATSLMP